VGCTFSIGGGRKLTGRTRPARISAGLPALRRLCLFWSSVFGPQTTAAVRAYQGDIGVAVDGIVGDQTWWTPAGGAGATLASLAGLTTV